MESSSLALKYLPTPTEKITIPWDRNCLETLCTSSNERPSVITTITLAKRGSRRRLGLKSLR